MGEYAKFDGQEIKIGTCEDMYYLRASQAHLVKPLSGNVDPVKDAEALRFRFPFPDEDGIMPGDFHDKGYGRVLSMNSVPVPIEVEHHSVQFQAPGYLVSLPCPESNPAGLKFHRNANPGPVGFGQQRWVNGQLVLIARCNGCGAAFRLPTLADAAPYIAECRVRSGNAKVAKDDSGAAFWEEVAKRIEDGYAAVVPNAPARKAG